MKHTVLSLILAVGFIFSVTQPLYAAATENDIPSDSTITRVYEEVLSGNITNEEDVLRVALAQDISRTASASDNSRSITQPDDTDDSSPMISQILETTTDEEGNTIYLIADTGLLVVNENGEQVNRHYLRTTRTFSDLNITARHTVYYYLKLADIFDYGMVKLYRMSTMITYGGSTRASKLEHYYHYDHTPYLIGGYTNMSQSREYIDTYSAADWVSASDEDASAGFGTSVRIYYEDDGETKHKVISIDVTAAYAFDPDGSW